MEDAPEPYQAVYLASVALKALNIHSEDPANADLWISDVHEKLALGHHEDTSFLPHSS